MTNFQINFNVISTCYQNFNSLSNPAWCCGMVRFGVFCTLCSNFPDIYGSEKQILNRERERKIKTKKQKIVKALKEQITNENFFLRYKLLLYYYYYYADPGTTIPKE